MDPNKVVNDLLEDNKEWANEMTSDFFAGLPNPQEPKVLWIGCSDSRVPAAVVTKSPPGAIFAHTNIANQFHSSDNNAHSVLSYAIHTLKVKHVVLVGHTGCGGVKEAIITAAKEEPVELNTPLACWLDPLVQRVKYLELGAKDPSKDEVNKVVKDNITEQVKNIRNSEAVANAWKEGKEVFVHGWIYNLDDGFIEPVPM